MNINEIRKDFPILKQKIYGNPLVYFDNAATTQKPQCVIDKLTEVYTDYNSNVHRGVHFLSNKATDEVEQARLTVQNFINAKHNHEVIFTSGATQSINLVAQSFGKAFFKENDEIIVSEMEHHSNMVPWVEVAKQQKAKIIKWRFDDNGELHTSDLQKLITEKTKFIAVNHISNTLGTINPVKEIISLAHQHNIKVLIDGAQSVKHCKIDMQDLDCDFFVFSGHKIYAPNGVGVLCGKEELLEKMPPYMFGGSMVKNVSFNDINYGELPFKFEAGTPNYYANIGLAEALKYIENIGLENITNYETKLLKYAEEKLKNIPEVTIYGNAKNKSSVISFLVKGVHPYDVGTILDKKGIAVRTGMHCCEPIMTHFGIKGTVRASFSFYNTIEEINVFCDVLKRAIAILS